MTTTALGYLKVSSENFPEINWKMVCFAGFLVSLPLLVFYVWQINDLTEGSYLINNYEKEVSRLAEENKDLQVSFAENSFLGEALSKVQALNFQKVSSVKYIQIPEGSVAKAR